MNWHPVFETKIPMVPVAKGRPRFGNGRTFTPKKTKDAENLIQAVVKKQFKLKPFDGPLRVEVVFMFERPKSSKNEYPIVRPDLDNIFKLVADALNGILWKDDSQIIELASMKIYDVRPGILLTLYALGR